MVTGRSHMFELVRINDTLNWSHDRSQSLVDAVGILREVTGARIAPTYLLNPTGDLLVLIADQETREAVGARHHTLPVHEHLRDPWMNAAEWPVSAADNQDSAGWGVLSDDFKAWFGAHGVCVHIHADGRHLGATLLCFDQPWPLTEDRAEFLAAVGRVLGNAVYRWQVAGRERELGALEERRRLGDELHVDLSQQVATLGLHVEGMRLDAAAGDHRRFDEGLARLDELVGGLNRSLRHQMLGLRQDSELVQGTFEEQVRQHVRTFQRQLAIPVDLDYPEDAASVPLTVGAQLVRVLQEALSNVHLHSHADRVQVRVQVTSTRIRLEVTDDGNGFDPSSVPDSRLGVQIMSERMQQVDGEVRFEHGLLGGTQVVAEAPLRPARDTHPLPEEARA